METLKNIPNIKEFKPIIMMTVPALAKNFRKANSPKHQLVQKEKNRTSVLYALDLA